ncbi:response regulator [Mucilaginibacter sp. HMF5004]|uniref:response regulator n=1 Tax=Mucilaginibacter rivuli TaxID=2857527 RepID=UPI001C5FB30F|nr:response regulator [Mucilaginibacter rivuli]MBW4891806.1 response regulator [Mucilaginibacter rivuli]
MSKPFILCFIDDDEVYQYTVTRSLRNTELAKKILIFNDGEEAMGFLVDNIANNEHLPDIIFLDINMPIMDGWHFLEEYVKLKPRLSKQIIIYMITTSVDPVDKEQADRISEISDYIIKPITPDMLKGLVDKYTRSQKG